MSSLGNKEIMASNIKRYMQLFGKDRNDVCRDLGFKYTTFTDWINGNTYPRIDKIEMMANYFGISKADLVEAPSETKTPTILEFYNLLNELGKAEALKRVEELTYLPRYTAANVNSVTYISPSDSTLNAAHADAGASFEDKKHDEDIMNDDKKWGN